MAHLPHPDPQSLAVVCAVITVSDSRWQSLTRSEVPDEDRSGHFIQAALQSAGHVVRHYEILPDEPAAVQATLQTLANDDAIQAIILNGGTGIAPRDTTYDAIAGLLEKELPGFGEIFRALSYAEIGSRAIASRATAGIYRQTVIFSLPGSTAAVRLGMEKLILPELVHLTRLLKASFAQHFALPHPSPPLVKGREPFHILPPLPRGD
jgi:molybdopterin adenylyltransferase